MKIGIVQVALSHGGAEKVGVMLANGLWQHGHDSFILTDMNEPVVYRVEDHVPIYDFAGKKAKAIIKWLKAIINIRHTIKQEKPDVIIGIMGLCTLVTYIACLGLRIPIVMTEHNSFERPASAPMPLSVKLFKFWINKIYKHITVLTEADKKVIGNRLRNVTVMPNPLLLKPIKEIPAKEKIVLAAGRVDAWHVKGFDVLIRAWARIVSSSKFQDSSWWLKIAGAGKKESFEYLMSILEDSDFKFQVSSDGQKIWRSEKYHIEFLGFQKDMESLYKKSEIFVLSSRYEGFGLVLIEAMSQGCAPVACDFKGRQREILKETLPSPPCLGREPDSAKGNNIKSSLSREDIGGSLPYREDIGGSSVCGVLCEPDNVDALASALEKMMKDEEYRKLAQRKSMERSKYYSLDNCINRWEDYLSQVKG